MKLVIGATGFLGSHVTRQLVENGEQVRVLTRPTSSMRALAGLDVEHVTGELVDADAVSRAMRGCDDVFYGAVDTRAWINDRSTLFGTNVDALRTVLDVAGEFDLRRFVFTSTMATIGRNPARTVGPDDEFNWDSRATEYVRSRVAAETLVLGRAQLGRVPAVAMCVSNTYGPGDVAPTPHGSFVAAAALGKLPFTVRGMATESVGVVDAARALILAADRGDIGRRYIVSERRIGLDEVIEIAARTGGRRPPRLVLPKPLMYVAGGLGSAATRLTGTPMRLQVSTVRLMHYMSAMDHSATSNDLDWQPRPVDEAIADGARYWLERARSRTGQPGHVTRPT